ncbi:hypothetical protein GGGNBK_18890 [Sporosarcina sp. ANT_H38]
MWHEMTFSEWILKEYGIKVTKAQMVLPTHFKEYKKYCSEKGIKEEWHK